MFHHNIQNIYLLYKIYYYSLTKDKIIKYIIYINQLKSIKLYTHVNHLLKLPETFH